MTITDTTSTPKVGDLIDFTDIGHHAGRSCRVAEIVENREGDPVLILEILYPEAGEKPFLAVILEDNDDLERITLQ